MDSPRPRPRVFGPRSGAGGRRPAVRGVVRRLVCDLADPSALEVQDPEVARPVVGLVTVAWDEEVLPVRRPHGAVRLVRFVQRRDLVVIGAVGPDEGDGGRVTVE